MIFVCPACGARSHTLTEQSDVDPSWTATCCKYAKPCNESDLIIENNRIVSTVYENQLLEAYLNDREINTDDYGKSLMMILIRGILRRRPDLTTGNDFITWCNDYEDEEDYPDHVQPEDSDEFD